MNQYYVLLSVEGTVSFIISSNFGTVTFHGALHELGDRLLTVENFV